MKAMWAKASAKLASMTARERALVFAAGALFTFAVVFFVAVDPAQRRLRALTAQMQSQKEEIAVLEKGGPVQSSDLDAGNRARIEALTEQIRAADAALAALQRDLVPADRVNGLLQDMLARDNRLTLVSLRTLPAEPLVPQEKAAADAKTADVPKNHTAHVYKHGVEITVQGAYSSLHDYLARLERLPSRMYWWRAHLEADSDARLSLIVTVYTLSLDRAWLQV
jgi:MSHA biogenesis protein MshJ